MYSRRRILWARGISESGNAIRQAVLALSILSIRDNPRDLFWGELLETFGMIAMMVVGPLFVDRFARKISLAVADLLCVANSFFLFYGAINSSIEILLVGSFFTTFFSSFYRANLDALVSEGCSGDIVRLRNGLSGIQISILIGALVGLLGTSFSLPKIQIEYFYLIDSVTFLVSSFMVMGGASSSKISNEIRSPISDWFEGLRAAFSLPAVRLVVMSGFFGGIAYGLFESSSVVHLKNYVNLSDSWIMNSRALNRVSAIFAILGVFWVSKIYSIKKGMFFVLLGGGLAVLGLFSMSSSEAALYLSGSALFVAGLAVINPPLSAIIGNQVAQALLGRVFFFSGLVTYSGVLLGNAFMLKLGSIADTSTAFVVAAFIYVFRILFGLIAYSKVDKQA